MLFLAILLLLFSNGLLLSASSNFDAITSNVAINYTIPINILPINELSSVETIYLAETVAPSIEPRTISYNKVETTAFSTIYIAKVTENPIIYGNPFARLAGPNIVIIKEPIAKEGIKSKPIISKKLFDYKEPINVPNNRLPYIAPPKPKPLPRNPNPWLTMPSPPVISDERIAFRGGPCAPQRPGQSYPLRIPISATQFQFWSCQFPHSIPKLETCPPGTKFDLTKLSCLIIPPGFYPPQFNGQILDNGDDFFDDPPDTIVMHKGGQFVGDYNSQFYKERQNFPLGPPYRPFLNPFQAKSDVHFNNNRFGPNLLSYNNEPFVPPKYDFNARIKRSIENPIPDTRETRSIGKKGTSKNVKKGKKKTRKTNKKPKSYKKPAKTTRISQATKALNL